MPWASARFFNLRCDVTISTTAGARPPNLPAGYPIDVSFHYQPNGRLKVHVQVPNTNSQIETLGNEINVPVI
jgi:hypothetical protein